MSSLTSMTTLFRRIIFLYKLLLEFMVVSDWVLANFWVRHSIQIQIRYWQGSTLSRKRPWPIGGRERAHCSARHVHVAHPRRWQVRPSMGTNSAWLSRGTGPTNSDIQVVLYSCLAQLSSALPLNPLRNSALESKRNPGAELDWVPTQTTTTVYC